MKVFLHTLAVLAAALIVAALTYSFGQSSYAASLFPERRHDHESAQLAAGDAGSANLAAEAAAATSGAETQQVAREGHEHDEGPSLFGAFEVLKNLLLVGLIVGLTRLLIRGRRLVLRGG